MSNLIYKTVYFFLLVLLMTCMPFVSVKAQGGKKIIQLSGIVLGEDSIAGIPGVHIYVPKAGRGTTTNRVGYFSMPVLEGDELVISAIGYERQFFKIPLYEKDNLTLVIELVSDTTFLETIEIMPFPTEEIFKEAVLALNLPINEYENANLNEELLTLMLKTVPMDGFANHQYYMDNWAQHQTDRFSPRANPFLNPFNWARFFKSLKSAKKK